LRKRPSQLQSKLVAAGFVALAWACGAPGAWALSKAPVTANRPPLRATYDAYILGPGDSLQIELLNIPELSGTISIDPVGTLYLPRLRALFVEGLTVEELRYFLTEQFKAYVKNPLLYVKPVGYRAVRVYAGGEINRPGHYLLSGSQQLDDQISIREGSSPLDTRRQTTSLQDFAAARVRLSRSATDDIPTLQGVSAQPLRWPTLFEALRAAQGVTPYSNLGEVQVVRKQPLSAGGGKMQAQVDFLRLVTNGDESVNIRLFDGDVINVARSPQVLREQLLAASRTNLSPDYVEVFVSGRVKEAGPQSLPKGATLNQAIASAGY
jgi:polysaccharide export outer membrane protein